VQNASHPSFNLGLFSSLELSNHWSFTSKLHTLTSFLLVELLNTLPAVKSPLQFQVKTFTDSFHRCEEHDGKAEWFMNGDVMAGDCMRRLDPELLQVDAEMWANYSQLHMNIFRQFVQEPYLDIFLEFQFNFNFN